MIYRIIAMIVLFTPAATSFAMGGHVRTMRRSHIKMQDVDTDSPVYQAINKLQEFFQNSPAAQFKKNLAKMQAGDYDESAINAKLDSLIEQPAVMFSFTT